MDGTELVNGGDHPALNFVNTRCAPWQEQIELLATGLTFLDWLVSAQLLGETDRVRLAGMVTVAELDQVAAEARELREWLRRQIGSWARAEASKGVPAAVAKRLNGILATDGQYLQLVTVPGGASQLQVRRRWNSADQLLVLPAGAAADLFANADRGLVRECDGHGCELWFYDRTKSHRRRWCSQAVCGNRDKVKNYRRRTRSADAVG